MVADGHPTAPWQRRRTGQSALPSAPFSRWPTLKFFASAIEPSSLGFEVEHQPTWSLAALSDYFQTWTSSSRAQQQWHAVPGDELPQFIDREIRDNDYVIIVCMPKYKESPTSASAVSATRRDIMTGEVFTRQNDRKFLPLLAKVHGHNQRPPG